MRPRPKETVQAWLVAYIDPSQNPPVICEAGIFPEYKPTKAERHNSRAQVVLLQTQSEDFTAAADEIKRILSGPEWRWIYRVPVLTSGFLHVWNAEKVCVICGVPEGHAVLSMGGRDPERCLVSHQGICSSCGKLRAILQGDALCAACKYPQS